MKRVAFNALLLDPRAGGVAVYMKHLIGGMLETEHGQWQPRIFLRPEAMRAFGYSPSPEFVAVPVAHRPAGRIAEEFFAWRRLLRRHGIDLLHSPISYFTPGVPVPTIITVHDLRILHFPESYTPLRRAFLQKIIPWSVHHADHIIAVSHYTKSDLVERLKVPPDKVTVIHSGVEVERFAAPFSDEEKERVRRKYHLPREYVLAVGHLEPRKNYERLIEAFALLRRRGVCHALVIVGRENWRFKSIYERVRRLGLGDAVRFTHFVDAEDLPLIYQMTSLFVAPSLFEGFGFTPLEAMAAGVPVAASNATSHPEVCGDAAEYFDPYDKEGTASVLERMLRGDQRERLVEMGRRRVLQFRWEVCCRKTFELYKRWLN